MIIRQVAALSDLLGVKRVQRRRFKSLRLNHEGIRSFDSTGEYIELDESGLVNLVIAEEESGTPCVAVDKAGYGRIPRHQWRRGGLPSLVLLQLTLKAQHGLGCSNGLKHRELVVHAVRLNLSVGVGN